MADEQELQQAEQEVQAEKPADDAVEPVNPDPAD